MDTVGLVSQRRKRKLNQALLYAGVDVDANWGVEGESDGAAHGVDTYIQMCGRGLYGG